MLLESVLLYCPLLGIQLIGVLGGSGAASTVNEHWHIESLWCIAFPHCK